MRASRRWAASAPSTASISISTIAKQAAEWTEKALGELAPAEAAGTATVVHVDFKGGAQLADDDEPQFTAENPLDRRDRDARQSQRHAARRARPGTSRSPPRRRASPICRATPSASCPRTIPASRWSWPRRSGLGADGARRAEAARALRRDDAVARAGRGLRQAHAAHRRGAPRRAEGLHRVRRATASSSICSRPIPRSSPPISCSACCARCPAASTRSPRASRRTRARRICSSAPCAGSRTARSAGRRLDLLRRPPQGRRSGAHLRQAEPPLPPARGRQPPDHHDRRRHRRRALPRLHRGARRGRRQGQELAVLRRAQLHQRLPLPARMAGVPGRAARCRASTSPSRATSRRRSTCSSGCGKRAPTCSSGSRTAPTSTCAATRRAWRATSTSCSARILAEAARGDDEAGRAKLKELTKAGRYQRDVY